MELRRNLAILATSGAVAGLAALGSAPGAAGTTTTPAIEVPGTHDAAASATGADFDAQWEELIAAAQAEGELSFVSGPGVEEDTPFFEAFGELYGLEISNFGGATDEVTARVSAERDQGIYSYDIGNLGGSGTDNFLAADFFAPIPSLMIHPDLVDHANFAYDDIPWLDESRQFCLYYAIHAEGNITPIYYNTETVSQDDLDQLESWFDLLEPRWNSRIVIGDIGSGESIGDVILLWTVLGQEWFDGLFANEPTVMPYGSAREHADALIRGDFDIGLFPPGDQSLQEAIDQGLPIATYDETMIEGAPRDLSQRVCVMRDAPHPAAAQLFLNWVFTEEGGTVYNETTQRFGRAHIRLDVPIGNIPQEVFDRVRSESTPVVDELDPDVIAAGPVVEAYLDEKYDELGIEPGS
jgi:iron(III) transport system substrate-binding protein